MRTNFYHPKRGSYWPMLSACLAKSTGPVLELGSGPFSTPCLHWTCFPTRRPLVTAENNPEWFGFAKEFYQDDFHTIQCVKNWEDLDLSAPWGVAFVDHSPGERRIHDIRRLTHAEYVVAHDAENVSAKQYQYHKIFDLFRYRIKYVALAKYPSTLVLSNVHDLQDLLC